MILPENRLPLFRIMRSSPCGGTGRRARLKIVFRKEWGFDSLHGHQPGDIRRNPPRLVFGEQLRLHPQSVCGGSSSSLSLAVNIAIRRSASARVRFG
jgi:hypothetical protein